MYQVTGCDVTLKVDKNPSVEKNQEIEIVMSVKGTVLRTKEASHDMYASIDAAADSVKRKLRKYRSDLPARPAPSRRKVDRDEARRRAQTMKTLLSSGKARTVTSRLQSPRARAKVACQRSYVALYMSWRAFISAS